VLTADTAECPTCAYGEVEDIVILEAQPLAPLAHPAEGRSSIPRILALLACLVVVIVVIFAALR
jgi:hypothetical protein